MVVSNFAIADESLIEKGQIAESDHMQKLSAERAEYQAMLRKLAMYWRLQRFMEALKRIFIPSLWLSPITR